MSSINSPDFVRFGEKLRVLRTRRNLTLIQLSEQLGYRAHGYLSEIESGKKSPTAALALKVSRLFGVSTDALLKDELELPLCDEDGSLVIQ